MSATTNEIENVIWFNPLFSVNVNTKVKYYFLNLIRMHFPPRHKLFNRNTIKVTYNYVPNIKVEIHKHNKYILEKAQQKYPDAKLCNSAALQLVIAETHVEIMNSAFVFPVKTKSQPNI